MSRCRFCANIFPHHTYIYSHLLGKAIRVSRCRFGGINMFGGFHVFAGSLIKLRPKKRYSHLAVSWNVWGFHELGLFWQVPWSNYDQKNGTVVWPLFAMFGGFHELGLFWHFFCCVFWWVPQSNYKLRPEKRYSHLAIGWNVYYVLLTHFKWG